MKWKEFLIAALLMLQFGSIYASGSMNVSENDSTLAPKITGVNDFVWLTDWNYASLDRMSMLVNTGDYGFYGPQPMFMLDSIPFEPSFFGVAYSQFFPVPHFQTHQKELISGHGVINGIRYQSGIMRLRSEPLKDGFSVFASGQYGHNSGEPGPWVFDPERVSPNVERFGPWINGGVSLKFGNWYAKGLLKFQEYKHVDEFVQLRMLNSRRSPTDPAEWLGVDTRSVLTLAETGFEGSMISIKLQAYQAESEDFLFFQPFAREIPSELTMNQYSASTDLKLHRRLGIRGLYQLREQGLGYRLNRFDHNFDWQKETHNMHGSVYFSGERFSAEAGAALENRSVQAPGLSDYDLDIMSLFLDQQVQVIPQIALSANAQVSFLDDERAIQIGGNLLLKPTSFWGMDLGASYSELLPEVANPLDHQVRNGYYIFQHLEIPFQLPEQIKNTRKISLSTSQRFFSAHTFSLGFNAEWMHHISMNIPFQAALYDLEYSTIPGNYSLLSEISGQRLQAGAELQFVPLRNMIHQADVTITRTLSGGAEYEAYWKMIPEVLVQYAIEYTPFYDVYLALNLQYRSEATWSEFSNLDGELNRTFHVQYPFRFFEFSDTTPSHFKIDLKMGKWFWGNRLRGELLLKNLLNTNYQTHPLGVRERFGYMARVEMRF
ncbi:MAG: hypothetical protein EA391_14175 [Balneolaceae bacterium]|nr:MAG: hypothetical protein EA391_14175 [Balneolaceae bacterium]